MKMADTILHSAVVVTMDGELRVLRDGAVTVAGDRIAAVGVGDMPKNPSSQYGLKAQEDIDPRGIRVTNGPMR
jgi:cytosine/adenosine deaminase-related metal-dependent hydrolase